MFEKYRIIVRTLETYPERSKLIEDFVYKGKEELWKGRIYPEGYDFAEAEYNLPPAIIIENNNDTLSMEEFDDSKTAFRERASEVEIQKRRWHKIGWKTFETSEIIEIDSSIRNYKK